MNGMDEEAKDRLFTLLGERVLSLEKTIRLMNTQLRALEIAIQGHQAIFDVLAASNGKPATD